MRAVFLLLALVALSSLVGCSRTHLINPTYQEDRARTNQLAQGQRIIVTLHNGRRMKAEALHMAPDVTMWFNPHSDSLWTVPTSEIAAVQQVDNPRGALQGLGLGLAVGAVGGGALILSSPGADSPEEFALSWIGASLFVCTSPIVGGFIGFARGDRTTFEMTEGDALFDAAVSVRPLAPYERSRN